MSEELNFEQAVELLKNAIKYSNIEGQKHLDLSVVPASESERYQKALMITRQQVAQGLVSEDDLKHMLGLV
jgi:hypothetical protein